MPVYEAPKAREVCEPKGLAAVAAEGLRKARVYKVWGFCAFSEHLSTPPPPHLDFVQFSSISLRAAPS